jgi:hypothetical protein
MTLPYSVGKVGTRAYDALEPIATPDESLGWPLLAYVSGLALPSEEVADLAETGDNGEVGWSVLLDIDRVPDKAIGWLAQFIGVRLNPDLDTATQRTRVRETDGWNRGTLGAFAGAAHQYLTGAQHVIIRERFNPADPDVDHAYHIQVITYTAETPDSAKVLAALLEQKPAGIILHYEVFDGQDFETLFLDNPDFQGVYTTYATFQGVFTATPGT